MISRPVSVIVGNSPAALAAKAATMRIPVVFVAGADPIRDGFVTSVNRPGGNVTGVTFLSELLGSKRLEMLRSLAPRGTTIAVLSYPDSAGMVAERKEIETAAQAIGQQLLVLDLSGDRNIESAFETALQRGARALLVGSGAFLNSNRQRVVALAAHHGLPALYPLREFVSAGGLMSYGTSITDAYREAGVYTGRILKGEKPGDLPVVQATKFAFVINLRTAKTLGIDIPPTLLALADEVIE
jgi:putative ABC transport system substrate-binding protein